MSARWVVLGWLAMGAAQAQTGSPTSASEQRCLDAFRAESARIERTHAARPPGKGDLAAQQAWAASLHGELARAADRAEACSRAARAPQEAAALPALTACMARVDQAFEARRKAIATQSPTRAEQDALRALENSWQSERIACQRTGRAL